MTTHKPSASPSTAEPVPARRPASLVYVTDALPGISRKRRGKNFSYHHPDGRRIASTEELARIRALAIPPAYTQVWICPLAHGHLQATGRDARGRKQYRYHLLWRSARDEDKFGRMREFGMALARIRRRVTQDLGRPVGQHVQRHSVLAAVIRLLDTTLMRVGNEEYARTNRSYGLTTLKNRHAQVQGSQLRLKFRGKSGVLHDVSLADPRVARVVRQCQALPGQDLFQYEDDEGSLHTLGSADVNQYLKDVGGADFTAKDFRTWHASVLALSLLCGCELGAVPKSQLNEVLSKVAQRLGNTLAVCRKSYVHPGLLTSASLGELQARLEAASPAAATRPRARGLTADEQRLLALLEGLKVPCQGKPPRRRKPVQRAAAA